MTRINPWGIEPGVWKHLGGHGVFVVVEIVTHEFRDSEMKERTEPLVVYRDLQFNTETQVIYSMELSQFKSKFTKE